MTALTPTAAAIPADILAAAENALDTLLCNCREAGDVRQDSIRDIARAILAERERCAQIAEAVDTNRGNEAFIAHSIRNPPFAAPAVPHTTTPSSESPEGEAQSLSGPQSDGDAFAAVKGKARLASAAGVEPSPSDIHHDASVGAA